MSKEKECPYQNECAPPNISRAVAAVGITLCYALFAYNDGLINKEVMDYYRDTFAPEILSLVQPSSAD